MYEFTEEENQTFQNFTENFLYLVISLLLVGTLMIIQSLIPDYSWVDFVIGFILLLLSVGLFVSTRYFNRILVTSGDDISHLLQGITYLHKGLNILLVLMGIFVVGLIIDYFRFLI